MTSTTLDAPVYLTPKEAAARLRLAPGTLANWRNSNRGPKYIKHPGHVLYLTTDLDAWAMAGYVEPGKAA